MAVRIAESTKTSPESWLNMQTKVDLWKALQDEPKNIIRFPDNNSTNRKKVKRHIN